MKKLTLASLMVATTCFNSGISIAGDMDNVINSVDDFRVNVANNPSNTISNDKSRTTVSCTARGGWEMATSGLGSPQQCINNENYIVVMREWSTVYASIKNR